MKRIILASHSAQRRKLLQLAGFQFTVQPSRVREVRKLTTPIPALVKHNARLKAAFVAARLREGLVIGADTLVYSGGKIIGKPRSLKEAGTILRRLAQRPHWVYTGVVVMDAKTKRYLADYEKTKIYFDRISEDEMKAYHHRTPPFDKAGGFDIEGQGGFFIRRIEGCYTNVIGLPLAKLRKMLKKMGVSVFGLMAFLHITGCASEFNLATLKEETLFIGTEKEIHLGDALARQFDENFEIFTDVDVNTKAQRILEQIVEVCDRKELIYRIKVINEDKMNAVSLPGGYIYINKGLIDRVDTDDQLASVIAHEVGHITAKHSIKKLQASYGYALLQVLAVSTQDAHLAQGLNTAYLSIFLNHSQQDEFLADQLAVKYMRKAGFDPNAVPEMLQKLKEYEEKEEVRPLSYWRTHPHLSARIAHARQEVTGELEFKDYLNITGSEGTW